MDVIGITERGTRDSGRVDFGGSLRCGEEGAPSNRCRGVRLEIGHYVGWKVAGDALPKDDDVRVRPGGTVDRLEYHDLGREGRCMSDVIVSNTMTWGGKGGA